MDTKVTAKRRAIQHGLFKAEVDEYLRRELAAEGYAGVECKISSSQIIIVIVATRTQPILGEKGRRIRELASLLQHRFKLEAASLDLYVDKLLMRGLSAATQAESLRFKMNGGVAVRKACYTILKFVMESGAQGVEIVVSGKLRGQRAKSMKFTQGLMIHSGDPVKHYIDEEVRHVDLRQGILGLKVKIMQPFDPTGKRGTRIPLPDKIPILEPKEDQPTCTLVSAT